MVVIMLPIIFYMFRRSLSKPKVDEPKVCELLYFYTSWCPYCKKSTVEWNKFKSEWHHKKMDGYELIAICNHVGNTRGGHYTAMVKKETWYECNDEVIRPANPITNHAYCLLFRKKTV